MPDWLVPLADVRYTDEEVQAVAAVYRSGWLSQGPLVAEFERAFATFVDSPEAIAVASGTAALQLALAAVGVTAGDEVVLPSLTFAATAAAVVHAGATPVFADLCAAQRPWLAADRALAAVSRRTRAIVNVAYAGHPGEVSELRALADARGLILIEDAAHAVGSWTSEPPQRPVVQRHAGTIGHAGAFSFYANKNLPLGEGGMLVTADPELARRARLLRSHGLTSTTWARHHGGELNYDILEAGFNYRLDEARAALGARLLARLDADTARRSALARGYTEALRDLVGAKPAIEPGPEVRCAWHLYPLLLDPGLDRDRFRSLMHDRGVQTSVHYPPLHLTSAFAVYARGTRLPVTEDYARRTVTVPLFTHMTGAQQTRVIEAMAAALGRVLTGP